jgi:F0F1-type ATP synthase membrane subunit b/b'
MEFLEKIMSQYGFGVTMTFVSIGILIYILKDRLKKEDKLTDIIKSGIESIEKLITKIERNHEENEINHKYQKDEHERLEKKIDNLKI